jgi:hypothetical protein
MLPLIMFSVIRAEKNIWTKSKGTEGTKKKIYNSEFRNLNSSHHIGRAEMCTYSWKKTSREETSLET